tara:strand:- start:6 stop:401 length:396 start_codon:yes stop_codon:yes gene_type:complete
MNAENIYTVPELAKELNLTERAIRFYESKGLLFPKRAGNTRIFNYKDRARLIIIRRAKKLGFSLKDIKKYLDLYDVDQEHDEQTKLALRGVKERITYLEDQKEEINIVLSELKKLEKTLLSNSSRNQKSKL